MFNIKYTSFAFPPYEIKLDKVYSFGQDSKGYFYADAKSRNYLDLDEIKTLFSPVEETWDVALKKPKAAQKEI